MPRFGGHSLWYWLLLVGLLVTGFLLVYGFFPVGWDYYYYYRPLTDDWWRQPLAAMAGNVALTLGAFGGVYIGGGIVPRYIGALRESGFRENFERKGRYKEYLGAIPTWVIVDRYPALKGLVALARDRFPT